ncbi:unnamed protein product [Nippostrongylus brasiliensis]|uniref:Titin-like n=1 Tax=Nippostrongylus brasiliensis TaxID=27835 RepID=A0A0N4Y2N4_NIPBR|nr:unnamed protein product [Nippostrongylus brasiliensis]
MDLKIEHLENKSNFEGYPFRGRVTRSKASFEDIPVWLFQLEYQMPEKKKRATVNAGPRRPPVKRVKPKKEPKAPKRDKPIIRKPYVRRAVKREPGEKFVTKRQLRSNASFDEVPIWAFEMEKKRNKKVATMPAEPVKVTSWCNLVKEEPQEPSELDVPQEPVRPQQVDIATSYLNVMAVKEEPEVEKEDPHVVVERILERISHYGPDVYRAHMPVNHYARWQVKFQKLRLSD